MSEASAPDKKAWTAPKLVIYGTAREITLGHGQPKIPGLQDDWNNPEGPQCNPTANTCS